MRAAILVALLILDATPALAQSVTYTISPRNGSTQHVQGSDGSNYDYSYGTDGTYIIQKDGAAGHYQSSTATDGGGSLQGVGTNWTPPLLVAPGQ